MCPQCKNFKSDVMSTRQRDGTLVRRRSCMTCGVRFTTHEKVYVPPPKPPE